MSEDITQNVKYKGYQHSEIPDNILDMFFDMLQTKQESEVKTYYDIILDRDDITKKIEVPTRKVVTESAPSVKDVVSIFEKLYPQYFDEITIQRIKQIEKNTGTNDEESLNESIRKAFKVGSEDNE